MLLEELNNVRSEMERQRMLAAQGDAEIQQTEMAYNKERAHADHWKAQVQREQEELDRVTTLLKQIEGTVAEIQLTARGSEKGGAKHVAQRRELMTAIGRRNEAETKLLALQREQEARMTAVFSEHKKVLEKLETERLEKRKDRDDIASSMTRWRTQVWAGCRVAAYSAHAQ